VSNRANTPVTIAASAQPNPMSTTKCSAAYTSANAIASGYATSSGRQPRLTRRHRKIEIIAVNAACSEGIAATRFTLACPELTSVPADCRFSVPQPRVDIRSMNW